MLKCMFVFNYNKNLFAKIFVFTLLLELNFLHYSAKNW